MKVKKYSLPALVKIGFSVFVLIIIGLGVGYYGIEKRAVRQEAVENLVSIARLKVDHIAAWRKDRLQEGAEMLIRPHLVERLTGCLSNPQDTTHDELLSDFHIFRQQHGLLNVLLADANGTIRLSLDGPFEEPAQCALALDTAFRDRLPVLTELHTDKENPESHISVVSPLFFDKAQSRPAGAVILVTDPSKFLYPLIQSWPVNSDSAESLLVKRDDNDVLFLNTLRHQADTALKLRIPLIQTDLPAAMAVEGRQGAAIGIDYRGIEVVSVLIPVPDSPWFMVAKVDAEEVFAPWRSRAVLIIGLLACTLAMLGTFALFARQYEQKRQYLSMYRTEAELRTVTERHSVTLKSIGDAVIVTNTQGQVELLNSVAEELTGWRDEEARGRPLEEVFHIVNEHTRALVESPVAKVVRRGMVVGLANHTLLINRNGVERPIADSGAPIRNAEGEITGVVLVFRDQSEERAYQSKILESESFYRQTLESIPGMVFTTRPDGYCDYQSQQWVEYTGVPMDQHLGDGWNRLLHPDDRSRVFSAWHTAVEDNTPYELEYRIRRHDGIYEWFRVIGRKIHDKEGRIVRWFGTALNIEALKQAEHALLRLNETLEEKVSERTQLAEARAKQLQALAVELIDTEERERRRIAHLLHEDLQQMLAAARFQLQAIGRGSATEPVLAIVTEILEESIAKSRSLSHELSPPVLHHGSLYSALEWLAGQMREQFGLKVLCWTRIFRSVLKMVL
jgi:PAS domain S-box-containing protein